MPRATQPIHVLRKHCLYIIYTFESSYCLQCSGTGTLHFYITNEPIDGANYAPETYELTVTALLSNLNLMEISSLSLSLSRVVVCRQPYPPFNWTNSTSRLKSRRQHIRICALEFLKYTWAYLLAWLLCHQQYQLLYLLLDYHKDWVSPAKFKPTCITYRILFARW